MNADTITKNWCLVDFTQDGERIKKRVLWGIVIKGRERRWIPGDCGCTSLVVNEHENQLFETRSSFYKANDGARSRIDARLETFQLLRSGYSPDQWSAMTSLGGKLERF